MSDMVVHLTPYTCLHGCLEWQIKTIQHSQAKKKKKNTVNQPIFIPRTFLKNMFIGQWASSAGIKKYPEF